MGLLVSTGLCSVHDTIATYSGESKVCVCIRKPPAIFDFLFMNVLKIYGKEESRYSSFVDTVYSFSAGIRRLQKCGVLHLKKGKIRCMDGLPIPSGVRL